MKSVACLTSSVRAACHHTSCFPLIRGLNLSSPLGRCSHEDSTSKTVVASQPRVLGVRTFHKSHVNTAAVQQVSAAPLPTPVTIPLNREEELTVYQTGRGMSSTTLAQPAPHLSPYSPYIKPQSNAAVPVNIQSLVEGGVIPELCSELAGFPRSERAEGLATLLQACVEFGLEPHSPLVLILINECLELLSSRDIGVTELCHLGEVAHALEGCHSALVTEVLDCLAIAVEEDVASPSETARIYSLLALCHRPASVHQKHMLSTLHRRTQKRAHLLQTSQVSEILQALSELPQYESSPLLLRLCHRASRAFKGSSNDEVIKLLSTLMMLGHHDEKLLAAMEKHIPGRLETCDPELISAVLKYCLKLKYRSEPILEAVAENLACHAEKYSDPQIAEQIVAMGRLNYLPQCSSEMFRKLESILATRFSHFQPRALIDVLQACIYLERFPYNYIPKVFSPYFLQRLQEEGEPSQKTLGQLTQLHLSTLLDCIHHLGRGLPDFPYVKKFSSVNEDFETPMDNFLYAKLKGPLTKLLGAKLFYTKIRTRYGYITDVEIHVDEKGYVLPPSEWDFSDRRIALCLDSRNHFCSNTQHLLGKEATKRRHLRRMGYEVVQIPYFEIENLDSQEDMVQYLHNKISPIILKFRDTSDSLNKLN